MLSFLRIGIRNALAIKGAREEGALPFARIWMNDVKALRKCKLSPPYISKICDTRKPDLPQPVPLGMDLNADWTSSLSINTSFEWGECCCEVALGRGISDGCLSCNIWYVTGPWGANPWYWRDLMALPKFPSSPAILVHLWMLENSEQGLLDWGRGLVFWEERRSRINESLDSALSSHLWIRVWKNSRSAAFLLRDDNLYALSPGGRLWSKHLGKIRNWIQSEIVELFVFLFKCEVNIREILWRNCFEKDLTVCISSNNIDCSRDVSYWRGGRLLLVIGVGERMFKRFRWALDSLRLRGELPFLTLDVSCRKL